MKNDEIRGYEERFKKFMNDLEDVAGYYPKTKFLYPIMRGVPFQDFQVALTMAKVEYRKFVNDNKGKKKSSE